MDRRSFVLAAALAAAFAAAPAQAADKVIFRFDWINSGYQAPFYLGLDKGFYAKAGIDLDIVEGKGSAVTAQTVGNGSVQFGLADAGSVMGLVSQGLPVKMVAGYLRQSPMAIMYPTANHWKTVADMKGAKIGWSAGGASAQLLPALLKAAGIEGEVQLVNMEPATKMTALLSGQINGVEGFDLTIVPLLESKGLKVSTFPYAAHGINVPGLALIARNEMLTKDPGLVRRFVAASAEAVKAAQADPTGAVDALEKRAPTLDRGVATRTLDLAFKLYNPDWAKGHPFGWLSPAVIEKSQEILLQYGSVKNKVPPGNYFTDDFVPKG